MSPPTALVPLSLAELRALTIPPRDDLIEDLLPTGQVTLFAAREKSGKTLIANDAACAIASEQPFLDRAVRCGAVIFIALEENIREVRARILERIGTGVEDAAVPLYVLPANGFGELVFRLDDAESMAAFARMIDAYRARLVVIDTMREAHGLRENESDDMAALVRPLRQIAHGTNCAVLLIHHMSRAGNARGSTAIAAGADQLWSFQRTDRDGEAQGGNPAGTLVVEGRFGPPVALRIRLGDGLRWEIDGTPAIADSSARGAVLACIRQHPEGLTAEQIASETNRKVKTIQNEFSRLLQETPPPIAAIGNPSRGNPRRYIAVDADGRDDHGPDDGDGGMDAPAPASADPARGGCSHGSRNDGSHLRLIVPDSQSLGGGIGRNDSTAAPTVDSHASGNDGNELGHDTQVESTVPDSHALGHSPGRNDAKRADADGGYVEVMF